VYTVPGANPRSEHPKVGSGLTRKHSSLLIPFMRYEEKSVLNISLECEK